MRNRFLSALFVGLALTCIPGPSQVDDSFTIEPAIITRITTEQNDTITQYKQGFIGLYFQTGHTDCFQRHDSMVVREDSTLYVEVKQKVYNNRLCLDLGQTALWTVRLGDTMSAGEYTVIANHHTKDTLRYKFWIHPLAPRWNTGDKPTTY